MHSSFSQRRSFAAAIAAMLPIAATGAEPSTAELLQRIDELSQKVLVLERKLEITDEAAATAKTTTPVVKASPKGFSLQSADAQNVVKLRGTLHFDGRYFTDDVDARDGGHLAPAPRAPDDRRHARRHLRLPLHARLRRRPDDHPRRVRRRAAPAVARRSRPASSRCRWASSACSRPTTSVSSSAPFRPGSLPNRDLGVSVGGDVLDGVASYSRRLLQRRHRRRQQRCDRRRRNRHGRGLRGTRVRLNPFANSDSFALRGLGLGIGGTYVDVTGSAANPLLPTYRTPGQQTFFRYRAGSTTLPAGATYADGERLRWSPAVLLLRGDVRAARRIRAGLAGRFPHTRRRVRSATPWTCRPGSCAAHWFLTGEEQSFKGFKPNNVFSLENGTWGAFELVARYQEMDVGDEAFAGGANSFADPAASPSQASAYGVGVNWYLNENYKWQLDYERTSFEGGAAGGADRDDEEVFLTRIAVGF